MDLLEHPSFAPGRLLLGRCPGRDRQYLGEALERDLGALRARGVGRVVVLLPEDELLRLGIGDLFERLEEGDFTCHHLPIVDGATPDDRSAFALFAELEVALARGETVAIHCRAGLGRTGTVAAAFLILRGLPPSEAIEVVRDARPGAVDNERQEVYLHQLAIAVSQAR